VRDARLVHLLNLALAPHLGRSLATATDPLARLSPRLRQTLDCLLEGDSEKQVAARLGLALPTVREYVQLLYRHFEVNSRAELMAYFLRRYRRPGPPRDG
jgi:DNA-binding NarL/FixJ family response regulator